MSEQITLITVVFAAMLAFALLIERVLEVLKTAYYVLDSKRDLHRFWTTRTYSTQQYLEHRLHMFDYVDAQASAGVLNRFHDLLLAPAHGYRGTVPVLSGDLVRAVWIRLACKLIGIVLGVMLSLTLRLDLTSLTPSMVGMLLTGVAIGLGSGPVHKLIRVAEKKRAANLPRVVPNA